MPRVPGRADRLQEQHRAPQQRWCFDSRLRQPPPEPADGITIKGNIFDDIDGQKWGGNNGYFLQFDRRSGSRRWDPDVDGGPILGFAFTNNRIRHGVYGMKGSGSGTGNDNDPGLSLVRLRALLIDPGQW